MPENPDGMQVSSLPTVGSPATVDTPVGSGDSSSAFASPTRIDRVDVVTLPALSSASTVRVTVSPMSPAVGYQRIWNGKETFRCTSAPPTVRRTSFMSPRSSTGSTSISTGSAALTVAFSPGRSQVTVGAVVSAAVGSRCAIARRTTSLRRPGDAICSRPKPSDTESRVEMIAPPFVLVTPV